MATKAKGRSQESEEDEYPEDAPAYLRAAGWVKNDPAEVPNRSKTWQDPNTGQPAKQIYAGEEFTEEGRPSRPVYQQQVSGSPWYYSEKEAVAMQQERDKARGS